MAVEMNFETATRKNPGYGPAWLLVLLSSFIIFVALYHINIICEWQCWVGTFVLLYLLYTQYTNSFTKHLHEYTNIDHILYVKCILVYLLRVCEHIMKTFHMNSKRNNNICTKRVLKYNNKLGKTFWQASPPYMWKQS